MFKQLKPKTKNRNLPVLSVECNNWSCCTVIRLYNPWVILHPYTHYSLSIIAKTFSKPVMYNSLLNAPMYPIIIQESFIHRGNCPSNVKLSHKSQKREKQYSKSYHLF